MADKIKGIMKGFKAALKDENQAHRFYRDLYLAIDEWSRECHRQGDYELEKWILEFFMPEIKHIMDDEFEHSIMLQNLIEELERI